VLLSIDPGMNSPGVALFMPDPKGGPWPVLVAAARLASPRHLADNDAGQRWFYVADAIASWYFRTSSDHRDLVLAFEKPQWYQRAKSKGDPNDLVGVAGVAANVCGMLRPAKIYSPEPSVWIGQLSKVCKACKGVAKKKCLVCRGSAWETVRGQYIRKRLTADELAKCPDQNDAIDAVGIGLWASGRLTPHTVFSNGRDGR
jgi:hypothetical protein